MDSGQLRIEKCDKRIRAMADGEIVADSVDVLMVWEKPYFPTYFFPLDDVAEGGADRDGAYRSHDDRLSDYLAFRWNSVDAWFEEDEEVFVHARDPGTRVDALRSSRHVKVQIDGVEVANSVRPTVLFETGLPARYYLPKTDVRFEHFTPSETVSSCPYKGQARYWHAEIDGRRHEDVLWGYDFPLPESQAIAGMVCFYPERADIEVDGRAV